MLDYQSSYYFSQCYAEVLECFIYSSTATESTTKFVCARLKNPTLLEAIWSTIDNTDNKDNNQLPVDIHRVKNKTYILMQLKANPEIQNGEQHLCLGTKSWEIN